MISLVGNAVSGLSFRTKSNTSKNNFQYRFNQKCDEVCFASKVTNNKKRDVSFEGVRLILQGAPAAGKGSLTEVLLKKFNVPHIETGGMLRAALKEGSEIGLKAKEFMDQGKLVPDEVVIDIVADRLKKADCQNGFILDGFPRTIEQAKSLDKILEKDGTKVQIVNIEMDIPKQKYLERIIYRQSCPDKDCGSVFNSKLHPPKQEGLCDKCGSKLVHRADDNEEAALKRLDTYEQQTKPLVEYYEKQGNLIKTKASMGTENIFKQIEGLIREDL